MYRLMEQIGARQLLFALRRAGVKEDIFLSDQMMKRLKLVEANWRIRRRALYGGWRISYKSKQYKS